MCSVAVASNKHIVSLLNHFEFQTDVAIQEMKWKDISEVDQYLHFEVHTVDGERFGGLNIHGFSAIEVFAEIFSLCLGHKYSLFSIIRERHLYPWKNFCGTLENCEKHESLAQ